MRSGYDEHEICDWSSIDQEFSERVVDKTFVQTTFYVLPSLRALRPEGGWICSKPYNGEGFDASAWEVVPGGWDHEHCTLCFAKIVDGMTYWANAGEVVSLCDRCFEHYRSILSVPTQ